MTPTKGVNSYLEQLETWWERRDKIGCTNSKKTCSRQRLLSLQRSWDSTMAPVVQKLDSAIHRINIRETNRAIQWIEIYPVNDVHHLFNNLVLAYILQSWLSILKKNTKYDGNKLIMNIVLVYYRRKILCNLVI